MAKSNIEIIDEGYDVDSEYQANRYWKALVGWTLEMIEIEFDKIDVSKQDYETILEIVRDAALRADAHVGERFTVDQLIEFENEENDDARRLLRGVKKLIKQRGISEYHATKFVKYVRGEDEGW